MNGHAFPFRELILFLTFAVILVTLVGQGLMLPWVIRALGLAHVGRGERHTERAEAHMARRQAIAAAVERLDQLAAERNLSKEMMQPIRSSHRDRLKQLKNRGDRDDSHGKDIELRDEIEHLLLAAERQKINELFRSGKVKEEVRRRIERELDVREAQLNQRTEE